MKAFRLIPSNLQDGKLHEEHEEVVRQLTENQNRIQAFIFTLTGDRELARDLLQSTNLVIWRKADEFTTGTNFLAWAFQIARYQVMAYRRHASRERLLFSDDFIEELAIAAATSLGEGLIEAKRAALAQCLDKISEKHRHIIWRFYRDNWRIREIAEEIGKSVSAVEQMLSRTRLVLQRCIKRRMEGTL